MCTSRWIITYENFTPLAVISLRESTKAWRAHSSEKSTCRLQSTRIAVIYFLFVCISPPEWESAHQSGMFAVMYQVCIRFSQLWRASGFGKKRLLMLHLGVIAPTHHWNEFGSKLYCGAQRAQKQVYWWFLYLKSDRKCALVPVEKVLFV